MVSMVSKKFIANASGWAGMVLIHAATVPTTINLLMGLSDKTPPASMVLLVWCGLVLFLINSIITNNKLYTVSNSIGFFFNSALLALIVFK